MDTGLASLLILAGFTLVVAGILVILLSLLPRQGGEVRGGGVVLIGPIPIILGTDREVVKYAILLTIVALAVMTLLVVLHAP